MVRVEHLDKLLHLRVDHVSCALVVELRKDLDESMLELAEIDVPPLQPIYTHESEAIDSVRSPLISHVHDVTQHYVLDLDLEVTAGVGPSHTH